MRVNVIVSGVSGFFLVACSMADIAGTGLDEPAVVERPEQAEKCSTGPKLAAEDPTKLPKCACAKGGQARCVAKSKLPSDLASQLEACDQGACVPDALVKSGGAAPPTCKSPFGEGRCMSICVPEVAKNAALLDRGEGNTCGEDERCAPCKNPLKNNEPTGVCEIGKAPSDQCTKPPPPSTGGGGGTAPGACPHTGPAIVDVTTFPSCGEGARCVPATLVPASGAAMLKPCPTGLCAPEKSIAAGGQYLPPTCRSVGNAEGRCLNTSIAAVEAQKAQLPQAICAADERCVPCFSPLDGKATGACSTVSCDKPTEGAATFKACCNRQGTPRGLCVPSSSVPADQAARLGNDDGACGADLCAPEENVKGTPGPVVTCTGKGVLGSILGKSYSGVCVSDCIELDFFSKLGVEKGSCPQNRICTPCVNPLDQKPTGAPGCPP